MLRFIIKNNEAVFGGTSGNFDIDFTKFILPSKTNRYKLTLENVTVYSNPLNYIYITSDLIDNSISNINNCYNILCSILMYYDNDIGDIKYKGSLSNQYKFEIGNFNRIVNFKIYDETWEILNDAVCILEFSIKPIN